MTSTPWIPETLSPALRAVQTELMDWRHKHEGRGRIPESIWDRAVALACIEGPTLVAGALQLPLDSLTQRVQDAKALPEQGETGQFVELTADVCDGEVPNPVAVITMTGPQGEYLSVQLSPDAWEAGGIIVDTFFAYLERP